jgi:hypothetical protein
MLLLTFTSLFLPFHRLFFALLAQSCFGWFVAYFHVEKHVLMICFYCMLAIIWPYFV